LGRRRSVAGATSRRCPSARMRPGAGYLPTLALGRPRGSPVGVPRMTLLRTSPGLVYRVYSEEEFLTAEEWSEPLETEPVEAGLHFALLGEGEPRFAALESGESCLAALESGESCLAALGDGAPRPWGRIAAVTSLALAVLVVAGVVVMNELRSKAAPERRLADGGIAAEPAREDPATDSSPTDRGPHRGEVGREQRPRSASTAIRRPTGRHARFAPAPPSPAAARARAPSRSHPAAALPAPASTSAATATTALEPVAASPVAPAPSRTTTAMATATETVTATPTATATAAGAAATATETATATPTATETAVGTATATTAVAGGSGREFGFER
jgi:hypothetical protein